MNKNEQLFNANLDNEIPRRDVAQTRSSDNLKFFPRKAQIIVFKLNIAKLNEVKSNISNTDSGATQNFI